MRIVDTDQAKTAFEQLSAATLAGKPITKLVA